MGPGPSKSRERKKTLSGKSRSEETVATTVGPPVNLSSNSNSAVNSSSGSESKKGSQINLAQSQAPPSQSPKNIKPPAKSNSLKSESDSKAAFSMKKLEEFFEKYKEPDNPQIGPEGIEALCKDIGVEPDNVVMLVFAWHLNAQSMGYFKKDEFITGLQTLGVDSVERLKSQLGVFRSELDDPSKYKEIYRYAFGFAKEKESKILDLTMSDELINLLMGGRFPHAEKLRQFLKEQTTYKSINLDQWMNILEFSRTIKADLSNYDENGAWPVLLDEFCAWAVDR